MRTKTYGYQLLLALLSALAVASCSTPPIETMARARVSSAFAEAPQERPGLGTKWGETRKSATSATTFERATPNQPVATAEIFYNDRADIEAMAAVAQLWRSCGVFGRLSPGRRRA